MAEKLLVIPTDAIKKIWWLVKLWKVVRAENASVHIFMYSYAVACLCMLYVYAFKTKAMIALRNFLSLVAVSNIWLITIPFCLHSVIDSQELFFSSHQCVLWGLHFPKPYQCYKSYWFYLSSLYRILIVRQSHDFWTRGRIVRFLRT